MSLTESHHAKTRYVDGISEGLWKSCAIKAIRVGWLPGVEAASKRLSQSTMRSVALVQLFDHRRGLQQRFRTLERALAAIGRTQCGSCLFGRPVDLQKSYDEVEHALLSAGGDRLRTPEQHLQVIASWVWSVIRLFDAPLRDDLKDDMLKTADPMSVNDAKRNWELIAQGLAGMIETLSAFSFGGCRSYTHTYSLKDAPLGILLGELLNEGYEIDREQ